MLDSDKPTCLVLLFGEGLFGMCLLSLSLNQEASSTSCAGRPPPHCPLPVVNFSHAGLATGDATAGDRPSRYRD